MRYNIFGYLFKEGFKSIFKQKKMSSASIIIMCATMFMFGIFFLISENVNFVMRQVESQQGMRVILQKELSDDDMNGIGNKIRQIQGVNKATFVSEAEALSTVKTWLGEHQDVLVGYDEDNPFPASYFVTLTDLDLNDSVQEQILKIEGVTEIRGNNETISNLAVIAKNVQIITLVLLIILIVISIFIISYTIKLTVYARRREISIMKYVGATNGFIRTPLVVEGIIIGIISSALTLGIVSGLYNVALSKILESTVFKRVPVTLYSFNDLFVKILIVYIILGTGIGILGSVISMRKYLKV